MRSVFIAKIFIAFILIISDVRYTNEKRGLCTYSVIVIILSSDMCSSTYYMLKKKSINIALQNSTEFRAREVRILTEKRFLLSFVLYYFLHFICDIIL